MFGHTVGFLLKTINNLEKFISKHLRALYNRMEYYSKIIAIIYVKKKKFEILYDQNIS